MLAVFTRRQKIPSRSFFLFGPRSTGKSTWLRSNFEEATWFNLLNQTELIQLMREPQRLSEQIAVLPNGAWVVIDEVQRLPQLLDAVHDSLARRPKGPRFALTGSSARKLRRGQANLLAGRAITRNFFPLVASELEYAVAADDILRFGCLPMVQDEPDERARYELLEAYVATYLAEEIRAEALVKNLASFTRFLEVAALMNGQVTNVAGIARDAGVARPTVQGYVEVLVDTLIGSWLPAFRPRARVKESAHPKFYFFDSGVTRSLLRRLREPLDSAERGPLLETYVLHELRAYINDAGCGGELTYWRTPSGLEVDFIWSNGSKQVAIEAKASQRWRSSESAGLQALVADQPKTRPVAVYLGKERLKSDGVDVYPLMGFARALSDGDIL